jgi:hypothetical protein
MAAQALDELRSAHHDPGLRPAEQLVAGELVDRGKLGEPDDAEVGLVHAQEERSLRPDRALVVGGPGPVGRSDLDEPSARAGEDVRDPKPVADLDQLAARDEHVAPFGERRQCQEDRGGVVVDDQRGVRARQPPQQCGDVILPRAARAGGQVVLEVRVATADLADPLERGVGERRPPEIRVHDDPGRVQRPQQRRLPGGRELRRHPLREVSRLEPGSDLFTRARENGTGSVDGKRIVHCPRQLVDRGQVAQAHRPTGRRPCEARRGARRSAPGSSGRRSRPPPPGHR